MKILILQKYFMTAKLRKIVFYLSTMQNNAADVLQENHWKMEIC